MCITQCKHIQYSYVSNAFVQDTFKIGILFYCDVDISDTNWSANQRHVVLTEEVVRNVQADNQQSYSDSSSTLPIEKRYDNT